MTKKNNSILAIGKMRANPTAQLKGFAEHFSAFR